MGCSVSAFGGLLITAFVAAIAGWWFIRGYIIYDGDILGMRTSSQYAEMYAVEELKPSNRQTIQSTGMSILGMMAFVRGLAAQLADDGYGELHRHVRFYEGLHAVPAEQAVYSAVRCRRCRRADWYSAVVFCQEGQL